MSTSAAPSLTQLPDRFGDGWNYFWFTPSDPLMLSVLRIGAALVALYLLATFTPDMPRLLARGGWLPVETVAQMEGDEPAAGAFGSFGITRLSYLSYLSTPAELWTVHAVGLAALGLLALGWQTRITSVLSLIVVLSYVHRAPMLMTQVEPLLTMMLFYLCLGPAGACLSVDALRARRKDVALGAKPQARASVAANFAIKLLQVHLCMYYATMGLSKLLGAVWWNGTATWWLATRSESRLVDLTWLPEYATDLWTHAHLAFELGFAVLIWKPAARPALLLAAAVMWTLMTLLTGQLGFLAMILVANLAFADANRLRSCCRRMSCRRAD